MAFSGLIEYQFPAGLAKKLHAAALAVGPIAKAARNDEEGYSYVEAVAVIAAARKAILDQNVIVVPSMHKAVVERTPEDAQRYCRTSLIEVVFRVIDTESGEGYPITWAGQALDAGDKGYSKALTAALKYFLIDLLLIPIGDDPEADTSIDRHRMPRKTEAEIKASVERPGPTWAPSPPQRDPWKEEGAMYDLRCRRLGMSGRGSSAARAKVIEAVCGEKIARKNLTLVQLQAVNDELLRRLTEKLEPGAERMDSPTDDHGSAATSAAPAVPESGNGTSESEHPVESRETAVADEPAADPAEVNGDTAAALDQAIEEAVSVAAEDGGREITMEEEEEWPPRT